MSVHGIWVALEQVLAAQADDNLLRIEIVTARGWSSYAKDKVQLHASGDCVACWSDDHMHVDLYVLDDIISVRVQTHRQALVRPS